MWTPLRRPDPGRPDGASPLTRRAVLATSAAALLVGGGPVACSRPGPRTGSASETSHPADTLMPAAAPMRVRGADLSFLPEQEALTGPTRLPAVLADRGATHARLRVWVDPADGRHGLPVMLALARRTQAAGLRLSVALHLSDTWADPRHQQPPAAWRGLGTAELRRTLHDYTASVVQAFAVNGTPVDLLQVGNEIGNGFLWPTGSLLEDDPQGWAAFTSLLRAGLDGARQVPNPPRLAVHLESGGDNRACRRVLDRLADAGVDHDVTALSYYPFWNGPLAGLEDNLADLAERYGRDLLVAETAYPWTLADGDGTGNVVDDATQLPEGEEYPPTPQGQRDWYEALRAVLAAVPGGLGEGFLVWQPAWVPGVGVLPGRGNPHDNLGLFDRAGRALPALDCLRAS